MCPNPTLATINPVRTGLRLNPGHGTTVVIHCIINPVGAENYKEKTMTGHVRVNVTLRGIHVTPAALENR
jgi:hypothetical protein